MTYKTYDCNSYRIHTIKENKFKTCHLEIIFRKPVVKEDLAKDSLLVDVLTENSKKYPTRQELMLYLEELYKTAYWGLTSKAGNTMMLDFVLDFIDPIYIEEENYLENVLTLPFEMLENPNVINDEFDNKTFKICQKRNILEAKSIKEDGFRLSVTETLENLKNSPTSYHTMGTVEEIESITPANLYEHYKKLFKECTCDIFVIGSLDMDKVVEIIKKNFKKRVINKEVLSLNVDNEIRKKALIKNKNSEFIQTNLNLLFNITDLTAYEKNIVFNIYNYILGSGGITSKLYQEIREKNSYCYSINSMYLKYDGLLLIHVALDNKNKKNAIRLIKKVIKNMALGKFTNDDIKDAVDNYVMSLNLTFDNQVAILNNYVFYIFDNLPLIEDRIKMLKEVSYEDIVKVAKKLKLNTIYSLDGKEQE